MERADQQLKDSCTTNPVSCLSLLYRMYKTDWFVFPWGNRTKMIPTFLSTVLSLPLKAFTLDSGISVGERQRQGKSLLQP